MKNAGSSGPERAAGSLLDSHADSAHGYASRAADQAAVSKLNTLLEADPVNLAEVGAAIRAHPSLESLIFQMCESLAPTLGAPVSNAEEAAIVLGRDRLRILVRAWSVTQLREPARCGNCVGDVPSVRHEYPSNDAETAWPARPHTTETAPEAFYLANFLRCLGTDAAASAFATEASAGLTGTLAREVLFLMPYIETMKLTPEQRAALQEMLQFCR